MSIELDMWLLLKQADAQEEWNEQEEQEKEYFGSSFDQFKQFMKDFDMSKEEAENGAIYKKMRELWPNKHIAVGGYRMGFLLDDSYFLKVAKDQSGIVMSQRETQLNPNIFPKVYNYAPDYSWILTEVAEPFNYSYEKILVPELVEIDKTIEEYVASYYNGFKYKTIMSYEDYAKKKRDLGYNAEDILEYYQEEKKWIVKDNVEIEKLKKVTPGPNLQKIVKFFDFYPQASFDFKSDNLGVVQRGGKGAMGPTIVLVDAGLHSDLGNIHGSKNI